MLIKSKRTPKQLIALFAIAVCTLFLGYYLGHRYQIGQISQHGAIMMDNATPIELPEVLSAEMKDHWSILIKGESSEACNNLLTHFIEVSNRLAAYPKLQAQLQAILVATKENPSLNWQNIEWAHHIIIEEHQRDALFNTLNPSPVHDRWCSPAQSTAALLTPNGLHIANLPLDSATDIAESLRLIFES